MYADNLLARPFSSWRLKPEIGEPAYGYFARLVEDEGHKSLRIYATEIGLKGRNPDPAEILESLELLGLTDQHRDRLREYTPIVDRDFVTLGPNTLRRGQVSYQFRRFCPKCLAENPVHRVWWDIVPFMRCPVHDVCIMSETENGERIKWWSANIAVSPQGEQLTSIKPAKPGDNDTCLERFILTRLNVIQGPEPEMLIGRPLYAIIDAAGMLTQVFNFGEIGIATEKLAEGFRVLTSSRVALIDTLRSWLVENVPEARRKSGFANAYGQNSYFWIRKHKSLVARELFAAMREALAPVGRLGRTQAKALQGQNLELGLREVADRFGIHKDALKALAARIGLPTGRYNFFFEPSAINAIEKALADLVTLNETKAITGIEPHEFSRLEDAGMITSLTGVRRGGPHGKRYLRSEVDALVQRALDGLAVLVDVDARAIGALKRSENFRPSDFLIAMHQGKDVPVCVDTKFVGLASLCFQIPGVMNSGSRKRRRPVAAASGTRNLTFSEAAVNSGLTKSTISALVNVGAFKVVDQGTGFPLIDRNSFNQFHATYANAHLYRKVIGCAPKALIPMLREKGVAIGYKGSRFTTENVIVKREDIRTAFRIHVDPDDPAISSFPLWDAVRASVQVHCPTFFAPVVLANGEGRIATANNNVSVKADRDGQSEMFILTFEISEATSSRRWKKFAAEQDAILAATTDAYWEILDEQVIGTLYVGAQGDIDKAINWLIVLNTHITQKAKHS